MMDKSTEPADADPHAETLLLLPWLANGTLAGAELERVEAHLVECPACRARHAWDCGLRDACPPAPALSATLAFARLAPRLGERRGRAGVPVGRPGVAAANDARWLRSVAALQLGVIFILGLVIVRPGGEQASEAAPYRALGARPVEPARLMVCFDPATPEGELRRILQASGARIVDGPTDGGGYVLAVMPGQTQPVLQRLRAEPAVVLAEPLAAAML